MDMLESKLKDAYAGLNQQNEAITDLLAQRDDFVKKYNDSMKTQNEIVAKYNDLVSRLQKQQDSPK
jgi:ABC-type transporter Mla subunit MlaD